LIEDSDVYNPADWTTFRKTFGLDAYKDGSLTTVHPGKVCAVSDLALIILAALEGSFDQAGMSPHFINERSRRGSFRCCRITGICWVGAILNRGFQSSSHGALPKYSSMTCFRRESL
jgi:hypothetical protein